MHGIVFYKAKVPKANLKDLEFVKLSKHIFQLTGYGEVILAGKNAISSVIY